MQSAKLWCFLRKQFKIIGEADAFMLHSRSLGCPKNINRPFCFQVLFLCGQNLKKYFANENNSY
jgi:hypothetical protein